MGRKIRLGKGLFISQVLEEKRQKILSDLPEELEELSNRFEGSIPIFPIILDSEKFRKSIGREMIDSDFLYIDLFVPPCCCIYFNVRDTKSRTMAQKYLWDNYEINAVNYNMTNLRTVVTNVIESRKLKLNKEFKKLYKGPEFLELTAWKVY